MNQMLRASRVRSLIALISILLATAFVWGLISFVADRKNPAQDIETEHIPVTVLEITPKEIEYIATYLGRAEAYQTVEIRSRARGFLNDRLFVEGGPVAEGELMFAIDPKPLEAQVQVAKARLESARARLVQAERQVDRYGTLFVQGAATESELEEWETSLQVAVSDIELYRAQLVQTELDLGYAQITSPINGVVGQALKDVGAYVDDGSNSLLAIVEQIDPIYIRFSISEQDSLRMRRMREQGQLRGPDTESAMVRLTFRDGSEYEHHGRITYVDPAIDTTTSTISLRAEVSNSDFLLRPGQFVQVSLLGYSRPAMFVVPQQAVLQTPTNAAVFVASADGQTAELRAVRLGPWQSSGWIIEEGLEEGDLVIVNNISRLRRESPIRIEAWLDQIPAIATDELETDVDTPPIE